MRDMFKYVTRVDIDSNKTYRDVACQTNHSGLLSVFCDENDSSVSPAPPSHTTCSLTKQGKSWTKKEEDKMLDSLYENVDMESIARKHKRTVGAIESRRKQIAYRLYCGGQSIEDIMRRTKLEREQVDITIKRYQARYDQTLSRPPLYRKPKLI